MKKTAIVLSVFIFLSAACSSATEDAPENNGANRNTANTNAANSNINVVSNANAKVLPMNGVDPNAFNGNSSDLRTVNRAASDTRPTLGARPAPNESEFKAEGRPDGSFVETRAFKNHPQLLKIEKVTRGKDVSMKVYLKNGKSYPFTEEKIPNYRIAPPQNILIAIGVEKVNPNQPQSDKKENKETADRQR